MDTVTITTPEVSKKPIKSLSENSIWPNGIKTDNDGYTTFYTLGTNKINVPTSSSAWPKGNKLISPFVYQDDKLVGFCDTKAMEVGDATTIVMPYEHIEAEFSSIDKDTLQIATPKATFKKASWADGEMEDIPEAQYKYKGCKTLDDVKAVDGNYKTTDIVDGTWSEILCDLEDSNPTIAWSRGMFYDCSNLTTFTSDLSSLTYGYCMFQYCSNLTTFTSDLSSLTNGNSMFYNCYNLTTFTSDLSSLIDGGRMFYGCSNLSSFNSDLSSLIGGGGMFYGCSNLSSFNSDLSSLIEGSEFMFGGCTNLTSFTSDLSSLTSAYDMFNRCTSLTSFDCNLSSLTNGNSMFDNCHNLTTFDSDLSSLIYGAYMFRECTSLTSFNSDLGSLTNGSYMFKDCKLDTTSVQNIARTIKDVNDMENQGECDMVWRYIHIDIDNTTPNSEEIEAFNLISSKGWTVYVNGNEHSSASPASVMTLDETGEEISTPIPFYAKPQQTDEKHARYIDSEGNFFIILGAQFIYGDDISTYGMFINEEDAAANMGLTKIERA